MPTPDPPHPTASSPTPTPTSTSPSPCLSPQSPPSPPPPLHPNETFLLSLPSLHLTLQLPSLPLSLHGYLHLSRTRLVLTPPPHLLAPLSLPLSWAHPSSLTLSRPFFSAPHLSLHLTPTALPPLFPSSPPLSLTTTCAAGARVLVKVEALEEQALARLYAALQAVLEEPGRTRSEARSLRRAADRRLRPTGEHVAFYDEGRPGVLLLAQKLHIPMRGNVETN